MTFFSIQLTLKIHKLSVSCVTWCDTFSFSVVSLKFCFCLLIKAIWRDFDHRWNISLFYFFFRHKIMKWPWLSPYFTSSVYSYWLVCIKFKYSEYKFYYTILQCELYQEEVEECNNCRFCTTTPIAFIFTRYCPFSMF